MFEPLLLANPDTNTLRPQRSRASTMAHGLRRPHVFVRLSLARLVDLFVAGWVVSERGGGWQVVGFAAWTAGLFLEVVVRG